MESKAYRMEKILPYEYKVHRLVKYVNLLKATLNFSLHFWVSPSQQLWFYIIIQKNVPYIFNQNYKHILMLIFTQYSLQPNEKSEKKLLSGKSIKG